MISALLARLLLWSFGGAALAATPLTRAALPISETRDFGAAVPFDEYEAENARSNGVLLGPDRRFGTIAAEASGRRAIRLSRKGDYVAFTLAHAANAITLRAALPDTSDGAGMDASLGLYVAGQRIGAMRLSSRYSWLYGKYPFSNDPRDGNGHHVFDHARLLLKHTLPAGTVVRLQIGDTDVAPWYVVDLADFERVAPPESAPTDAISVTAFGADPTGRRGSADAFRRAIAAGRSSSRPVWIPPGSFRVDAQLDVADVTIKGAGPWYTTVTGDPVGFYGHSARHVTLADFAIVGRVTERIDTVSRSGIGGAMGNGSVIRNLFIQHEKVGLWFDGPMDGIVVSGLRITDAMADGINLHRGVSHAVVSECFIRGVGDDGIAAWSGGAADHDISFVHNTIVAPTLANGIAIYGGHAIEVRGNLVADTITEGGGLHVGNRFKAVPASGEIVLDNNMLVRTGSFDPHWGFVVGATWFYALDAPIKAPIKLRRLHILDAGGPALQFMGSSIARVDVDTLQVEGGSAAIDVRTPTDLHMISDAADLAASPRVFH